MNNISDKNVLIIILVTVMVVFAFIFSVKSPERKIIESEIIWQEDLSNASTFDNDATKLVNYSKKSTLII